MPDGDDSSAASVSDLPNQSLEGLWDRLVYDPHYAAIISISIKHLRSLMYPDEIKPRLLNYIYATLLFSDANVDGKPLRRA